MEKRWNTFPSKILELSRLFCEVFCGQQGGNIGMAAAQFFIAWLHFRHQPVFHPPL